MKVYQAGDTGRALCHRDGRVTITYAYKDVPFRDGNGLARSILVGTCDTCGDAILIPAQSTPTIAAARKRAEHPLEVNIPAHFVELLDAATTRILDHATTEFRKPLLAYYIDRYASGTEDIKELSALLRDINVQVLESMPSKRLSMKFADTANEGLNFIINQSRLSKTDLVKSLVAKIDKDLVKPKTPKHLPELSTIGKVLYA